MVDPVVRYLAEDIANQAIELAKLKARNESLQEEIDDLADAQYSTDDDDPIDNPIEDDPEEEEDA